MIPPPQLLADGIALGASYGLTAAACTLMHGMVRGLGEASHPSRGLRLLPVPAMLFIAALFDLGLHLSPQISLQDESSRWGGAMLAVLGCGALLLAMLQFFLKRTLTGTALRATAQEPLAATLSGIEHPRMFRLTMGTSLLLLLAAILLQLMQAPSARSPVTGLWPGLMSLCAAFIGGLGRVRLAVLAGICVGVLETGVVLLCDGRVPGAAVLAVFTFSILILGFRRLAARARNGDEVVPYLAHLPSSVAGNSAGPRTGAPAPGPVTTLVTPATPPPLPASPAAPPTPNQACPDLLRFAEVKPLNESGGPAKGTSFVVPQGSITCLLGPSGTGKTALLNAASGLLPHAGAILLDGETITGMKPSHIKARGLVHAPKGRRLWTNLTVAENLALGAYLEVSPERKRENLGHVFALFPRLRERLHQRAGALSIGEQQMLCIARGLMGNPRLLLIDAPTMGVAPRLVPQLLEALLSAHTRLGITLLIAELDPSTSLDIATHAVLLGPDRVAFEGPAAALRSAPILAPTYGFS